MLKKPLCGLRAFSRLWHSQRFALQALKQVEHGQRHEDRVIFGQGGQIRFSARRWFARCRPLVVRRPARRAGGWCGLN